MNKRQKKKRATWYLKDLYKWLRRHPEEKDRFIKVLKERDRIKKDE